MIKSSTLLILVATGVAIFPFAANAGAENSTQSETKTSIVKFTPVERTQTLSNASKFSPQDSTRVEVDGITFRNHFVDPSELDKVTSEVEIVDSYTFEYDGKTYTNRIVDNDQ